jgi:hypothetical protein
LICHVLVVSSHRIVACGCVERKTTGKLHMFVSNHVEKVDI